MSRTEIDNILGRLQVEAIPHGRQAESAVADILWYINTGRASTEFLKALCGLSRSRVQTLLGKITKAGSTENVIKVTKKYLKVE